MRTVKPTVVILLAAFAALAAFTETAVSATLVVDPNGGGGYTSLQAAIDAAAPGDVISVRGGTYSMITVSKPLTIVAQPRATIRPPDPFTETQPYIQDPALTLQGSAGTGRVALVNLEIGGAWDASHFGTGGQGIRGGGFEELLISRCSVFGAVPFYLTGGAWSARAIEVSGALPRVVVTGSSVTAGPSDNDFYPSPTPPGRAAIYAPASTVLVLDSTVRGGDVVSELWTGQGGTSVPANPCPCPGLGGEGGPGIEADRAFVAGSTVLGGQGYGVFDASNTPPAPPIPWGSQPDGEPIVAQTIVPLAQDLLSTGPLTLGGTWTLAWLTPSSGGLLFASLEGASPIVIEPAGWWFLDPGPPLLVLPLANGPGTLTTFVPDSPPLLGVELWLQAHHPSSGLTRPVVEVVGT